ncbi:MAG: tetratricopeptide repeat protein [Pseudomonadota bacterium]
MTIKKTPAVGIPIKLLQRLGSVQNESTSPKSTSFYKDVKLKEPSSNLINSSSPARSLNSRSDRQLIIVSDGVRMMVRGNFQKARSSFKQAIKMGGRTNITLLRKWISESYFYEGKFDKALEELLITIKSSIKKNANIDSIIRHNIIPWALIIVSFTKRAHASKKLIAKFKERPLDIQKRLNITHDQLTKEKLTIASICFRFGKFVTGKKLLKQIFKNPPTYAKGLTEKFAKLYSQRRYHSASRFLNKLNRISADEKYDHKFYSLIMQGKRNEAKALLKRMNLFDKIRKKRMSYTNLLYNVLVQSYNYDNSFPRKRILHGTLYIKGSTQNFSQVGSELGLELRYNVSKNLSLFLNGKGNFSTDQSWRFGVGLGMDINFPIDIKEHHSFGFRNVNSGFISHIGKFSIETQLIGYYMFSFGKYLNHNIRFGAGLVLTGQKVFLGEKITSSPLLNLTYQFDF